MNQNVESNVVADALLAQNLVLKNRLNTSPFFIGTVIRISKPQEGGFKIGARVKIRPDSRFYKDAPGKMGVIVNLKADEPGWAYVQFPEIEAKNRYKIGGAEVGGEVDLDLEESALVVVNSQLVEVSVSGLKSRPGSTVKVNKDFKVVDVGEPLVSGTIAYVKRTIGDGLVEIDSSNGPKTVFAGEFDGKLEESDRVILNSTEIVIVKNLGIEDGTFTLEDATDVTWGDVVGQEEAKQQIMEVIDAMVRRPEHYDHYKKKKPAGFTLHGPPGCSKTMMCKAINTQLMAIYKEKGVDKPSGGFILVSGPEILDKFVGVGEATIRHIFARGRKFYKKYGIPAIIVIDEAEAVLAKRDSGVSSDVGKTLVPTFLSQMQGVRESGSIVILATNKPETLDYAVTRRGRTVMVEVKRPDKAAAKEIVLKNLKGIPLKGVTAEELASHLVEKFFDPNLKYFEFKCTDGEKTFSKFFTLGNLSSGAMFASLVEDDMKRTALKRDLQNEKPIDGLTREDADQAVRNAFVQNSALNHEEAMGAFAAGFTERILGVTKLHQAQA